MLSKEYKLDLQNLDTIVDDLIDFIKDKDCIVILRGDLASGKTTLVKRFVKNIGYDDKVTSPTFSLQSIYSNKIYHYDVYNKTLEEFISLGMLEEFENEGVHFIEWGDNKLQKILEDYGYEVIVINIEKLDDKRVYKIES